MLQIWSNYKGDCDDLCKQIILSKNSSPIILFECHPFKQCEERSMEFYGFYNTINVFNSIEIKTTNNDISYKFTNLDDFPELNGIELNFRIFDILWKKNKHIIMVDSVYMVVEKKGSSYTIISALIDKSHYLQEGDMCTNAYYHGNDLIIYNSGDVSSMVVIRQNPLCINTADKLSINKPIKLNRFEKIVTLYNNLIEKLDKINNKQIKIFKEKLITERPNIIHKLENYENIKDSEFSEYSERSEESDYEESS